MTAPTSNTVIRPVRDWSAALDQPYQMVHFRFHFLGERKEGAPPSTEILALTLPQAEKLAADLQGLIQGLKSNRDLSL
jgi:hypothetical protein